MVIIYSPSCSVRFTYTVNLIFGLMPGLNYEITNDTDKFLNNNDARINYSLTPYNEALNISPFGLLEETGIKNTTPDVGRWGDTPALFVTGGDVPFDIFSATFYLVSRYEEYTDALRDQHGRYTAAQSFAYKNGFLELPLINIWVNKLRLLLNKQFSLAIPALPYNYTPTLDIDQVYYYRHKPFLRNILGSLRQLYKGRFADAFSRLLVMARLQKDPNDTFEYQQKIHRKTGNQPVYFFLMGDASRYDPRPLYHHPSVSAIIRSLSAAYLVGIHPSYRSFNNKDIILAEKNRLETVINKPVTHSRQHFLRFSLPQSYRTLLSSGITYDYSMGYADAAGYRAGIAAPYPWFDLEKNEVTGLTIHPFAVMDVTLKNYMKLTPHKATEKIKKLNQPVKENGGHFISLWHNESLSELQEWENWREVYETTLSICKTG